MENHENVNTETKESLEFEKLKLEIVNLKQQSERSTFHIRKISLYFTIIVGLFTATNLLTQVFTTYQTSMTQERNESKKEISNYFVMLFSSDAGVVRAGSIGLYPYILENKYRDIIFSKFLYLLNNVMEPYPPEGYLKHDAYELGFMQPILNLISFFSEEQKKELYKAILKNKFLSATSFYVLDFLGESEENFITILKNNNYSVRRRAIEKLFQGNFNFSTKVIATCLNDDEWTVVTDSLESLAKLGPDQFLNMIYPLLNHPHDYVRSCAINAILSSKSPEGLNKIASNWRNHQKEWTETKESLCDCNKYIDYEKLESEFQKTGKGVEWGQVYD